jgi:hypothetical protein
MHGHQPAVEILARQVVQHQRLFSANRRGPAQHAETGIVRRDLVANLHQSAAIRAGDVDADPRVGRVQPLRWKLGIDI